MKAFLSHSSRDKEFVSAVAKELGRQFCVFDEQAFRSGDEFKVSIEHGLDESSVFVLFASLNALESIWVKFEIEEAWFQQLRKTLTKSLVYLIDSNIEVSRLPEWLSRALVRRANSPKIVARDIRDHLDEILRERQHPYFVGRNQDVEVLEQALTPLDGSVPPHAIFVTGLPGVGRRSLVRHTAPRILNLRKHVEIRVGEGDSINDICVSVADHVEPYSTREGFERIVQQIRSLSDQQALQRTLGNLRAMVQAGELPIFFDEGGLLDSEGYVREPIQAVLQAVEPNDDAYIFFVSSRRPQHTLGVAIPVVHLGPLKENEAKRLISMLASRANLDISIADMAELAEYVAGYPPAAYFAIQQGKNYGLDLVKRYKARLVEFRTSVFLRHFSTLNLNTNEQDLLRLMATYSPLPLPVVAMVLTVELRALHDILVRLIDLALVITTEDGYYRIADPVADAAVNAFGFPTDEHHKALARNLSEFLEKSQIDTPRLALSRVLFRAARLAKDDTVAKTAIHLANDLIRLTETLYHARKYADAVSFGYAALEERPDSVSARSYLTRALIQEEKWQEAEEQIHEFQRYAPLREVQFLTGFLERKRGRTLAAIDAYKESERLGRRGVAISRELALCYFLTGDHAEASRRITEAIERHGDNRYVVDLWAQIATRQRDEAAARQALGRLEVIDRPLYYHHRSSRFHLAFGRLPEARAAAQQAVECEDSPPFEVLTQLAYCEIESGNLEDAGKLLARLDRQFGNIRRDIRVGLRCRLEIALGRYGEALSQSGRITDKSTFFYKKIRHDALEGELHVSALRDNLRAGYEDELARLEAELTGITAEQFIPAELDMPPHSV